MCARYRLKLSLRHIAELLGLSVTELFEEFSERPRLNISISQRVPIVTLDDGQRKLAVAEWGFLAPWDKSKRIFNAAGETVAVKPTFRESFKARRCLIPADGFYEWPNKQPTLIHFADDRLFCFAGLWSGNAMTMITCVPNDFMRPVHHRMPVILRDIDYATVQRAEVVDPFDQITRLQRRDGQHERHAGLEREDRTLLGTRRE